MKVSHSAVKVVFWRGHVALSTPLSAAHWLVNLLTLSIRREQEHEKALRSGDNICRASVGTCLTSVFDPGPGWLWSRPRVPAHVLCSHASSLGTATHTLTHSALCALLYSHLHRTTIALVGTHDNLYILIHTLECETHSTLNAWNPCSLEKPIAYIHQYKKYIYC